MITKSIAVATEFSPSPAGRFPDDGPYPGELFRNTLLLPAINTCDRVIVDMVDTELPGSSFLEEAFGGLVRAGYSEQMLKSKLQIQSPRDSDQIRIWRYIHDAALQSAKVH